ncbi:tyrosine-type recombinase/integrase [Enterococcus sp. 2201sp1_2201st1_B8_2201SCRN_220225]|uniref:tyrosine-type recombinase/integrase n=1 Tax=unclassified Enterococcus TaxID=2608891 RepID=UPI0034A37E4F
MAKEVGSIEKRGPNTYRLRITSGYDENGKQIRPSKTITATSDRKAYAALDEWIEELKESGIIDLSIITVKYFVENMWKKQAPLLMQERTYQAYIDIIEGRILPTFKDRLLNEIKPYEIRNFVTSQKKLKKPEEDVSRQTKKRILAAFSSLFNIAWSEFRIVRDNPCKGIVLPAKTKEDRIKTGVQPPYSIEELETMFSKLENETLHVQAVILTSFVSSAREGEIAALERKHFLTESNQILFEQRIIKVRDQKPKRIDGLKNGDELFVDAPKYYFDTMEKYFEEREEQRKKLNIDTPTHDYVFGHLEGTPINPSSLYGCWKYFVKRNNLRMIRFHDLRHSAASYLIANPQISDKAVQEHLGHSDYRTTMNMYVHGIKESKKEVANAMEKLISPKK